MPPSPGPIPRLPVLSWQFFTGARQASLPSLLDQPSLCLSTSGRASILLAIEMLGIKAGDKVLVPTYHCPTMIAPVVNVGATPVFYPIDETGAPCLESLAHKPLDGVKAMLAAHYFGLPQSMQALRDWCDGAGIALIEDCAHSLFGTSGTRPVGQWGDIAIGSLTKFLPVPEGGCLVVNRAHRGRPSLSRPSWIHQVKAFVDIVHVAATFGRLTGLNTLLLGAFSLRRGLKGSRPADSDDQEAAAAAEASDGLTLDRALSHQRLSWAAAWVARRAPRERIVERRRQHFRTLATLLSGHEGLLPLHTQLPPGAAPYVFPLWVQHPDPGYGELRKLGIPVSRWDRLWPGMPEIDGDVGSRWSHHILQLACHQDLSDDEVLAIVAAVTRLYASGPARPSGEANRTLQPGALTTTQA